jgi:hypothetical protein
LYRNTETADGGFSLQLYRRGDIAIVFADNPAKNERKAGDVDGTSLPRYLQISFIWLPYIDEFGGAYAIRKASEIKERDAMAGANPAVKNRQSDAGGEARETRLDRKPIVSKDVTVPARRILGMSSSSVLPAIAYTDLNVLKGQKVRVTAAGTVKLGLRKNQLAGPEVLVFGIGEAGKPARQRVAGGADVTFTVEKPGGLFIGIRDHSPDDNHDSFQVTIEVFD